MQQSDIAAIKSDHVTPLLKTLPPMAFYLMGSNKTKALTTASKPYKSWPLGVSLNNTSAPLLRLIPLQPLGLCSCDFLLLEGPSQKYMHDSLPVALYSN